MLVRAPVAAASLTICRLRSHHAILEAQGVLLMRVGIECDQSIGSTFSDVIVHIWLWSTSTRSSPLGYFSILLQVVDN